MFYNQKSMFSHLAKVMGQGQPSDGSGSKIFDLGWVGSAIYGLGLNLEIFS